MSIMRRAALAAMGITVLSACAGTGRAQEPAPTVGPDRNRPVIQASGVADIQVTPDRAAISLGVMTRAVNVAQATAENARIQRAVIEAVRAQGIPAERIGTMGFNVTPNYRHDPRGQEPPTITGYTVTNIVRVEVHQIDRVGPIIDAALGAGANNMHGLHFWSSNVDQARRRALAQAVSRARADADAMAQAAGGQLGDLEALQYNVTPDYRPMAGVAMRMETAMADTPISPGEQTLTVTVTGRWLFVR